MEVSITVNGGSITGIGGTATNSSRINSIGILGNARIIVNSGSITGTGGTATNSSRIESYGVLANKITVNGGMLTGNGGTANICSWGVQAQGTITVSGGTLTGNGGSAKDADGKSYGVAAWAAITVTDGTLAGTSTWLNNGNSYGVVENSIRTHNLPTATHPGIIKSEVVGKPTTDGGDTPAPTTPTPTPIPTPIPTPTPMPSASPTPYIALFITDTTTPATIVDPSQPDIAYSNVIMGTQYGGKLTLTMGSGDVLTSDMLVALKKQNVTATLNYGKYTWTIRGSEIGDIPANTAYNLGITSMRRTYLSSAANGNDVMQLKIGTGKAWPFTGTFTVKIRSQYNGEELYLYRYDKSSKTLESVDSATVKSGTVMFDVTQPGEYVVTDTEVADD